MIVLLGLVAACVEDPAPPDPSTGSCDDHTGAPTMALAQVGPYGLADGDDIAYGDPPQGGSPYAPFLLKITGLSAAGTNTIRMRATAPGGEVLGATDLPARFTCANVGDHKGSFLGPELHMRFDGFSLDELDGRTATVAIEVTDPQGDSAEAGYTGTLRWVL